MRRFHIDFKKNYFLLLLLSLTVITLFGFLGGRELWTQEGRWGTICWNMLIRHDYLHPYCYGAPYYDKPLLTYWLPLLITAITGKFNEWTLRLPSALAGVAAVFALYRIGLTTANKRVGLIAAALLSTTFYFVFWARVASADMTNVAGILIVLAWYFHYRDNSRFFHYSVFFIIVALTALCKGLLAPVVVFLALLPELFQQNRWRQHLKFSLLAGMIVGVCLYLLPFWLSTSINNGNYHQNGLWLVFRENFLRYFAAFDHKEPFYVYFYYLPLYLLPWAPLFIPALYRQLRQFTKLSASARWSLSSFLLIFLFLTLSESRRSYYVLVMVPFAILVTAHWLNQASQRIQHVARYLFFISASLNLLYFVFLASPFFAKNDNTLITLATTTKQAATAIAPWENWQLVMVDGTIKMPFYFRASKPAIYLNPKQLPGQLKALQHKHRHLLIVSRAKAYKQLAPALQGMRIFKQQRSAVDQWLGQMDKNFSLVFCPHPSPPPSAGGR